MTELLNFRHKSSLAADVNAKHPLWNSVVSHTSGEKLLDLFHVSDFEISASQCPLQGMETCLTSWSIRMSDCQKSMSLISRSQITYQSFSTYWNMLELEIFQIQLNNSQTKQFRKIASNLVSPRIQINLGVLGCI
jgi:hypothetical protein